MANTGTRNHTQHTVQKTITSAQYRHQHLFFAVNDIAGGSFHWGFYLNSLQRHIARDLIGHQRAQFTQQAAKTVGTGIFAAHQGQLVLYQRVGDDVDVAHEN